jgi:hypothetical protein
MTEVCLFCDAGLVDGVGRVTRIHHQPALLDAATREQGTLVPALPPEPGPPARGHLWALKVRPATAEAWWEAERDPAFVPTVTPTEFVMRFEPEQWIAVEERRGADPVLRYFVGLLDRATADGTQINLLNAGVKKGVGYLVQIGMIGQADAERILTP